MDYALLNNLSWFLDATLVREYDIDTTTSSFRIT